MALLLPVLIELSSAFDLGTLFYFFVVAPIAAIAFLVAAIRRRSYAGWLMFAAFCLVSWACWTGAYSIRTHGRWLLTSKASKAAVLSQPEPTNGDLKHIAWDGWGFAGADTTVYLVYDPSDALSAASKSGSPGKFNGIPCEVYRIRRLERGWYSIVFYTDTVWENCHSS